MSKCKLDKRILSTTDARYHERALPPKVAFKAKGLLKLSARSCCCIESVALTAVVYARYTGGRRMQIPQALLGKVGEIRPLTNGFEKLPPQTLIDVWKWDDDKSERSLASFDLTIDPIDGCVDTWSLPKRAYLLDVDLRALDLSPLGANYKDVEFYVRLVATYETAPAPGANDECECIGRGVFEEERGDRIAGS